MYLPHPAEKEAKATRSGNARIHPAVSLLTLHPRRVYAITFQFVRVELYTIIRRLGSRLSEK